jgi:hypothetical protein
MWAYLQMWFPLLTTVLAATICLSAVPFMMGRVEASAINRAMRWPNRPRARMSGGEHGLRVGQASQRLPPRVRNPQHGDFHALPASPHALGRGGGQAGADQLDHLLDRDPVGEHDRLCDALNVLERGQ